MSMLYNRAFKIRSYPAADRAQVSFLFFTHGVLLIVVAHGNHRPLVSPLHCILLHFLSLVRSLQRTLSTHLAALALLSMIQCRITGWNAPMRSTSRSSVRVSSSAESKRSTYFWTIKYSSKISPKLPKSSSSSTSGGDHAWTMAYKAQRVIGERERVERDG